MQGARELVFYRDRVGNITSDRGVGLSHWHCLNLPATGHLESATSNKPGHEDP